MAPTTDSINPLLLTQKDWPLWFQFIRRKANFAKIWDYVDPDKAENEIKENTELAIPSIAAAPIVPATPVVALTAPAAAPTILAIAFTVLAATPVSTKTAIPASSNQQNN